MRVSKAAIAVASIVAATTLSVVPASSANAAYYCDGWWVYSSWGRGCAVDGYVQTDDTLTDGYCVEAKYRNNLGQWIRVANSTSCGSPSAAVPVPKDPNCTCTYQNVRVYRGNGNYFTIKTG